MARGSELGPATGWVARARGAARGSGLGVCGPDEDGFDYDAVSEAATRAKARRVSRHVPYSLGPHLTPTQPTTPFSPHRWHGSVKRGRAMEPVGRWPGGLGARGPDIGGRRAPERRRVLRTFTAGIGTRKLLHHLRGIPPWCRGRNQNKGKEVGKGRARTRARAKASRLSCKSPGHCLSPPL